MRQLKISVSRYSDPAPTPEAVAAAAEAWQVLQALPLPADLPEFAQPYFSKDGLRHILSVAEQVAGSSGDGCAEMAAAGHAAVITAAMRSRDDPRNFDKWAWWWIKSSIQQQHDLSPRRRETQARHRAEEAAARLALAALPAPAAPAAPPNLAGFAGLQARICATLAMKLLFWFAHEYEGQDLPFVELVLAGHHATVNHVPDPKQDPDQAQADWEQRARQGMLAAIQASRAGSAPS